MSEYSISNNEFLFKETYSGISRNHYNSDTVLLGQVPKSYKLQGLKDHVAVPLGMAGGVGGAVDGYLPEGGSEDGDQVEIVAKDVYGRAVVTRKSMKAAMSDKGSFVRFTKRPIMKCVERYNNWTNTLLHQDGTGRLGKTAADGYVSGGATAPILQMLVDTSADSFFDRWFERNDYVQIGNAGDTAVEDGMFKVTTVDAATSRVTLERISGSFDLSSSTNADDRYIYMQRSFKAMPQGFQSTIMATSGSIYGIPYSREWSSLQHDADGAPISIPLINKVCSEQGVRVGRGAGPNLILTSPEICSQLKDLHEGFKRYKLDPRAKELKGNAKFSFTGLQYDTDDGKTIGIMPDRHCRKDRMYLLNTDYMKMHHLPDQGWFDEDGKTFLRVANQDKYEARYGGYWEFVVHPTFQAVIHGIGL